MSIECKIPELGENVASGTVASVLVTVGQRVEKDQPLVELETEKAVLEVPSEAAGVVKEIRIKAGDTVKIGQTIVVLEDAAPQADKPTPSVEPKTAAPAVPATQAPPKAVGPQMIELKIPDLGENVEKGTVAGVLVKVGDVIAKEQGIIELETEKAVVEVPASEGGVVTEVSVKVGDVVTVGQAVVKLQGSGEAVQAPPVAAVPPPPAAKAPQPPAPAVASRPVTAAPAVVQAPGTHPAAPAAPSVRRFAREIGVNINEVKGSGPGGRISIDDVKAHSKKLLSEVRIGAAPVASVEPLPDFSRWGQTVREAMSSVREKTAVHLSHAWREIPHVTQFDKADITELENLRKQYGGKVEQAGGKLTVTAVLLKAVASALKLFPQFNASIDMMNKEIIYKKYFNIGIAVDTPRGLLVPVIRDVDRKNLTELSVELAEISKKARDRKLTLDDMSGGNFTISNLGGIGGTFFTPIINAPEVAILGVSRAAMEPVWRDGAWVPRLMLPLSLSYDHRLIDGADGARFIRWLVEALEQPFAMILQG